MSAIPIIAVVPVKETLAAKQRLASVFSPQLRQRLALAMLEDVLAALTAASRLSGIVIVTKDEAVQARARRLGIIVSSDGPLVEAEDIDSIAATRVGSRGFTIVPARDERGSNAILCWPAGAVPLRFGEDSYFPHLAAARDVGIAPRSLILPRIALDIDHPDDLAAFLKAPGETRAGALLREAGISLRDLKQEVGE
jgi:2-phospho-L-lactate guanylyltransferase (CobY/MobA/RfbA family)